MNWQEIKVSADNTCFLIDGKQIFGKSFLEVLKFHSPGLAPVKDNSGAYHIDINGNELYKNRYSRTFGFYCNRASVIEINRWFHINEKGGKVYSASYLWTGNYQENICIVRNHSNQYFHIDLNGNRIYTESYVYAGDYKDGIACVRTQDGFFRHIDNEGKLINDKSFLDLGVFHKNYATAKDINGWFHIDKQGNEVYKNRYLTIEPFYNGFALGTTFKNEKIIIDEKGQKILAV
ncbi:MAG: WG repeat-containing protein [Flavobacteriales bacterium]